MLKEARQQFRSFRRLVGRSILPAAIIRDASSDIFSQRAASPALPIFLEQVDLRLKQCQAPHTLAFFEVVTDQCREWFVYGNRFMTHQDKLLLTDPYDVGGFFNPMLGKSIEQLAYVQENNWFEIEMLLHNAVIAGRTAFLRGLSELGSTSVDEELVAKVKVEPEMVEVEKVHQSKKDFMNRWKEEFVQVFKGDIS